MATIKQINANRANAAKSTGPRTPEGKSTTRFNALKSGIRSQSETIPQESEEDLKTLTAQFHRQFQPATPEECALVDIVIRNEWLLRRMALVEGTWWDLKVRRAERQFVDDSDLMGPDFTRLQWRINSIQRNLCNALDRLKVLQAGREPVEFEVLESELASFGSAPPRPASAPAGTPATDPPTVRPQGLLDPEPFPCPQPEAA